MHVILRQKAKSQCAEGVLINDGVVAYPTPKLRLAGGGFSLPSKPRPQNSPRI